MSSLNSKILRYSIDEKLLKKNLKIITIIISHIRFTYKISPENNVNTRNEQLNSNYGYYCF